MRNEARNVWNRLGAKRLKLTNRPVCDLKTSSLTSSIPGGLVNYYIGSLNPELFKVLTSSGPPSSLIAKPLQSYFILYSNVVQRLWELSIILESYFHLYHSKPELYGERLLAHIGNEIIRAHSWIDFPFTSVNAQQILGDKIVTALSNFELRDKKVKAIVKSLHYEHWTPISFFRDIMHQHLKLTAEEIFEALVLNHRVVRITQDERKKLKGYEQIRPTNAYDIVGIEIFEREMWDATFTNQIS